MNLRLAIATWLVPITLGLLVAGIFVLDENVPWPEPVGEPMPCYGTEGGTTICPEEPVPEASSLRKLASALRSETVVGGLWLLAILSGLGCGITTVVRTRKSRREDRREQLAFRLALVALVLVTGVPLAGALFLLWVIASFPIRG